MKSFRAFCLVLVLPGVFLSGLTQAAGDPEKGKALAYTCTGCHGIPFYMNAYPSYHVPRLGNQNSAYIVAALTEYKDAKRSHKTMQAQAGSLSTQDMEDIATWIVSLKGEANKTERFPEETLAKGKKIAEAVCKNCHGLDGQGINDTYPKLAGQFSDYMIKALEDYQSGERQNPIMASFAKTLSEEDINNVAAYYASLENNRLTDLHLK